MAAQSAQSSSAAPNTHQPRRRARRRAPAALVAVVCLALLAAPAEASAHTPRSTSPAPHSWVLAPQSGATSAAGSGAEGADRGVALARVEAFSSSADGTSAEPTAVTTVTGAASAAVETATQTVINLEDGASSVLVPSAVAGAATASGDLAASSVAGEASSAGTATSAVSTSTVVPSGYQLPKPSTLGTNFTSTACPSFFETFLADPTFLSCAPFSLLLTTSSGFFAAERWPYSLLPYVLDASCSSTCDSLMDELAAKIRLSNTCGPDLNLGNPLAVEALQGFRNYRLYREVGCLKNNETERYCFAEAAANKEPDDLYLYYAPEGTSLPSGTTPDCGSCTSDLFATYARYATNSTLAISKTYSSARTAVGVACGPSFAPAVAAVSGTSAASRLSPSSSLLSTTLVSLLLPAALLLLAGTAV
ncbi:hypothetical protein JCM10207_001110 [Rhodosporidiobolus poonsookiae]